MMAFIQRLAKSLRFARTVDLPDDPTSAFYMLMPMVIGNQHKSVAELLSSSKYDVNFCAGKAKRTLLHISANVGSYDCMCVLLKKGSIVDTQDVSGCTPLHLAARNGQRKCLIKLLDNKANVNIRNNDGLTAIHWLAVNGRTELLLDLFQYFKDIDVEDAQGQTALHVACQNGHKSTVQCLIDHGADINSSNHYGWTPLHFACSHGQYDTAGYLLSRGAVLTVTTKQQTSLELCSEVTTEKHRVRDRMPSKTPLELSLEGGYSETCDVLLRHWPSLFTNLVDIIRDSSIKEAMLLKVMTFLCEKNGTGMADRLLQGLAQEISNIGHSLLSISSDVEVHVPSLLRCIKVLTKLYTITQRTPSVRTSVNTEKIFGPLELLWKLLEDWLAIVKVEFDHNNDIHRDLNVPGCAGNQRMVSSAPPDFYSRLSEEGTSGEGTSPENVFEGSLGSDDKNLSSSATATDSIQTTAEKPQTDKLLARPGEEQSSPKIDGHHKSPSKDGALNKMRGLSLDCQIESNIIETIMPRICAIIHGLYLVCTCTDHSQHGSAPPKFVSFVTSNKDVLKFLIARTPTVIFDHFHFLLDCPQLMTDFIHIIKAQPFEARRKWFYDNLLVDKELEDLVHTPSQDQDMLVISRESVFTSSCNEVLRLTPEKLKKGLTLKFDGEEGMGQGVIREWFDVLSREILNPDYGLFTQSPDGSTFQPNSNSSVNPDHLNYFRFAGQCLGLALYHQQLINVYFTRSFYKHILGIPVNYEDVSSIDPEYAKNLQWILDHDISELGLDLTFSVETDVFGIMEERELKPGGQKVTVTDLNKGEYVQLVTELRMTHAIRPQIDSFLSGFHQYIPAQLVQMFDEFELELLLSGIPEVDLEDWQNNTTYLDCTVDTPVIEWFWESMSEFSEQERILMLQFVTGSSRLPYGGFSKLMGGDGIQKFTISLVLHNVDLLPTASTCINFLRLPNYPSKDITKDRISVALHCGSQGYAQA